MKAEFTKRIATMEANGGGGGGDVRFTIVYIDPAR